MAYLLDTNILMRLVNASDVQHSLAKNAILTLGSRGEALHLTAQNLIEFRNGATRPITANGLGLSPSTAMLEAEKFEYLFPILPETSDIYPAWKILANSTATIGKQVHDARLVAICQIYNLSHLLTFNVQHFQRFGFLVPGLSAVHPKDI